MKLSLVLYNQLIFEAFKDIIKILFTGNKTSIKMLSSLPAIEKKEIAILIQFVDGIEGTMVLSCSKKTAFGIAEALSAPTLESEQNEENENTSIKDNMGEIMNMLAGKIAYSFQEEYGTTRLTTPAVIDGHDLLITVNNTNLISVYLELYFGIIEIALSIRERGE